MTRTNLVSQFIDWIFAPGDPDIDTRAEAFLAQAVDLHDLERRMRDLDRQRRIGPFGLNA
jgi:Protein of unknown function (DUF3563)